MIFNFSNEPTPPPYHQFTITGNVICDSIANKSNFTITLYGKSHYTNNEYTRAFSYQDINGNLTLTDSTGYYYLIAKNEFEFDSIKTAVIIPGSEPKFSKAYFVDTEKRIEIKKYIDGYNNDSGCCEQNVVMSQSGSMIIEYFKYSIRDILINLCK